ncbi:MAG: 1-phosphofructokinase family hexose kinase [Candidatus Zipacnadales bacterium]
MVSVLCLNAGIDRTYEVDDFQVGAYLRPLRLRVHAGGKGINVARIARRLGVEVIVSGFAGGVGGRLISRQLQSEGVLSDFVAIEEEPRVCINILSRRGRIQTRLDEAGPLVTPTELSHLRAKWQELLGKSQVTVISGSAPRGVPFSIYAELIMAARQAKVPVILDAHDELLVEGVKARPFMVKPNLEELSKLMGRTIQNAQQALVAAQELADSGINIVLVSMGSAGAVAATRKQGHWIAKPPKIELVSAVGSGDAMVAGFVAASLMGRSFADCLRWAVAAGAANAKRVENAGVTCDEVLSLVPEVQVNPVDALTPSTVLADSERLEE